jgi:hypothetical protein
MFGVLEIIFGCDRIAAGVGVARQLQVFFRDVMSVAADLHVRTIRLIGPGQRVGTSPIVGRPIAAHPLIVVVLTWSHRVFLGVCLE